MTEMANSFWRKLCLNKVMHGSCLSIFLFSLLRRSNFESPKHLSWGISSVTDLQALKSTIHHLPLKAPLCDDPGAWSSGGSRLHQTCICLSVLAVHCTLLSFHSVDCPLSVASATLHFQAEHTQKYGSELQCHFKLFIISSECCEVYHGCC